jgi:hypothetical protein
MIERKLRTIVQDVYWKMRHEARMPPCGVWVTTHDDLTGESAIEFAESASRRLINPTADMFFPATPSMVVFPTVQPLAGDSRKDTNRPWVSLAHWPGGGALAAFINDAWIMDPHGQQEPEVREKSHLGHIIYQWALLNHPCGYVVRSVKPSGFGRSAGQCRETASISFYTMVNFDRLYVEAKRGGVFIERRPGPRKAHHRHLWFRVGIDRHTLPRDPGERQAVSDQHRVPILWISDTWVGPSKFETDGWHHEILKNVEMRGDRAGQTADDDGED